MFNAVYLGLLCSLSCNIKVTKNRKKYVNLLTPKHASLRLTNVLMTVCNHRLPPWCKWDLHSSGMLRSVEWWSVREARVKQSMKNCWTAWNLQMGSIGCPATSETTNLRCAKTQKGANLIYITDTSRNTKTFYP